MFAPLLRDTARKRAALLLLASFVLNLLPAPPASAARRAQSAAAPFVRVLNLPVNDIAYDKQSKKLFASVPSRAGAGGNSVTEIDPATGALGASVFVGSEPNKLAISDDGQALYVGLDGASSVRRVDVASRTAGAKFGLGSDQFSGSTFTAGDLAVVPGNPNAVAVARIRSGQSPPGTGVAVYDNGVQRPNVAGSSGSGPSNIAFGATASTLYGSFPFSGFLQKMSVDASGVTVTGSTSFSTFVGELQFENGRLYNERGQVYNPATDAVVGTFANAGSGPFVVDVAAGRAFFIVNAQTHGNDPVTLRAYDINTFAPVGEIAIGGVLGTPTSLVRWGANGLAFRTNSNQLFLIQTALVPSAEPVPEPTPTPEATPTPTPAQVEASVRHVPLVTKDLVYVPSSQAIYASVPSAAGPSGNSVAAIDPATGAVGTPVFVGSEPTKLALADDGHTLYVGLNGSSSVRRFDTATQAAGLQFSLGTAPANPISDGFYNAADLAAMPGSPGTVAVSRVAGGFSSSNSLAVYDDGVKRPNTDSTGTDIEFASPARIYSTLLPFGPSIRRHAVNASGVSFDGSTGGGKGGSIRLADGLIYTSNGSVIDPETGELKGTFVLGETGSSGNQMAVDTAVGRAYFFTIVSGVQGRLSVYDINTFLPLGTIPVQYKVDPVEGLSFEYSSLVRWGENGLAFRTTSHVTIIQSALIGPGAFPNPTPTPSPTPVPSPTPQRPTFIRQVELPVRDVVYSPATQKLYASISGTTGAARGDSITAIDPATGALGASVSTGAGTEPDKLALSDDGQVLYLGYNGINAPHGPGAVRRFDLATQTLGPNISLGPDSNFGGQQWAYDIAVAPGNPNLIAVARYAGGSPPQKGVAIFDNGVQLPKTTPDHIEGSVSVAFSASPSTLYGGSTETGLKTIAVDSTGATVVNTAHFRFGPAIEFKNGLLYSGQGQVLNPATGTLVGKFNSSVVGRAMFIDTALNRAFFAAAGDVFGSSSMTITAYDLTTFIPVGRVTLPYSGTPTRLVRWGANGLALRASSSTFTGFLDHKLYLIQSALVSSADPIPTGVQFSVTTQSVPESNGAVLFNVIRTGDLGVASTVDYATSDGTASERSDYTTARGTLRFAPGESSKTVRVLLTDDAFQEEGETFSLTLSGASGAVISSPPSTVTIQDNDSPPPQGNPSDDANFFVRQHYRDFFSRPADPSGLSFWTRVIESCGSDAQCREVNRINVSGAFFLSIEFTETGYLVERTYKAAYGDATGTSTLNGTHQLQVPVIRFEEFLSDTQRIGSGVVVLAEGWEALLESNKVAFFQEFVQRPRFTTAFPATMTPTQFVDQLNARAGNPLDTGERQALINELTANNTTAGRASVVRKVAEDATLADAEKNRAFVLMQYFGYLRRNPNDLPDADYTGYDFWLGNLNHFNGNFVQAELVKAFISSIEYRQRFGP
ncbi:MAG TPA: Calx-beta domain-containing protein [Pyrinomonadaceae bacterium]|jgi:DNA-binding beta-propeller fold protein YncE|nr:Calx-beta domain-containing protein [Pyrinomonadaceae bacterium]